MLRRCHTCGARCHAGLNRHAEESAWRKRGIGRPHALLNHARSESLKYGPCSGLHLHSASALPLHCLVRPEVQRSRPSVYRLPLARRTRRKALVSSLNVCLCADPKNVTRTGSTRPITHYHDRLGLWLLASHFGAYTELTSNGVFASSHVLAPEYRGRTGNRCARLRSLGFRSECPQTSALRFGFRTALNACPKPSARSPITKARDGAGPPPIERLCSPSMNLAPNALAAEILSAGTGICSEHESFRARHSL